MVQSCATEIETPPAISGTFNLSHSRGRGSVGVSWGFGGLHEP